MRYRQLLLSMLLWLGSGATHASDFGPALGSKLPDFEAAGQDGKIRRLQSLLGPKGAVILFFRSADW